MRIQLLVTHVGGDRNRDNKARVVPVFLSQTLVVGVRCCLVLVEELVCWPLLFNKVFDTEGLRPKSDICAFVDDF